MGLVHPKKHDGWWGEEEREAIIVVVIKEGWEGIEGKIDRIGGLIITTTA